MKKTARKTRSMTLFEKSECTYVSLKLGEDAQLDLDIKVEQNDVDLESRSSRLRSFAARSQVVNVKIEENDANLKS